MQGGFEPIGVKITDRLSKDANPAIYRLIEIMQDTSIASERDFKNAMENANIKTDFGKTRKVQLSQKRALFQSVPEFVGTYKSLDKTQVHDALWRYRKQFVKAVKNGAFTGLKDITWESIVGAEPAPEENDENEGSGDDEQGDPENDEDDLEAKEKEEEEDDESLFDELSSNQQDFIKELQELPNTDNMTAKELETLFPRIDRTRQFLLPFMAKLAKHAEGTDLVIGKVSKVDAAKRIILYNRSNILALYGLSKKTAPGEAKAGGKDPFDDIPEELTDEEAAAQQKAAKEKAKAEDEAAAAEKAAADAKKAEEEAAEKARQEAERKAQEAAAKKAEEEAAKKAEEEAAAAAKKAEEEAAAEKATAEEERKAQEAAAAAEALRKAEEEAAEKAAAAAAEAERLAEAERKAQEAADAAEQARKEKADAEAAEKAKQEAEAAAAEALRKAEEEAAEKARQEAEAAAEKAAAERVPLDDAYMPYYELSNLKGGEQPLPGINLLVPPLTSATGDVAPIDGEDGLGTIEDAMNNIQGLTDGDAKRKARLEIVLQLISLLYFAQKQFPIKYGITSVSFRLKKNDKGEQVRFKAYNDIYELVPAYVVYMIPEPANVKRISKDALLEDIQEAYASDIRGLGAIIQSILAPEPKDDVVIRALRRTAGVMQNPDPKTVLLLESKVVTDGLFNAFTHPAWLTQGLGFYKGNLYTLDFMGMAEPDSITDFHSAPLLVATTVYKNGLAIRRLQDFEGQVDVIDDAPTFAGTTPAPSPTVDPSGAISGGTQEESEENDEKDSLAGGKGKEEEIPADEEEEKQPPPVADKIRETVIATWTEQYHILGKVFFNREQPRFDADNSEKIGIAISQVSQAFNNLSAEDKQQLLSAVFENATPKFTVASQGLVDTSDKDAKVFYPALDSGADESEALKYRFQVHSKSGKLALVVARYGSLYMQGIVGGIKYLSNPSDPINKVDLGKESVIAYMGTLPSDLKKAFTKIRTATGITRKKKKKTLTFTDLPEVLEGIEHAIGFRCDNGDYDTKALNDGIISVLTQKMADHKDALGETRHAPAAAALKMLRVGLPLDKENFDDFDQTLQTRYLHTLAVGTSILDKIAEGQNVPDELVDRCYAEWPIEALKN